jgi:hypothetical protein
MHSSMANRVAILRTRRSSTTTAVAALALCALMPVSTALADGPVSVWPVSPTPMSSGAASGPEVRFIRDISGVSPFPGCGFGNPAGEGSETSPILAINPGDPRNLIAYFIQSDMAGDVASVSHDGGRSWAEVVVAGQTLCNGGSAPGGGFPIFAFDPGVSFGGDGIAYVSTALQDIVFCDGSNPSCGSADFPDFDLVWRLQANSSSDGGDTWSNPVEIDMAGPYPHLALDAPAITGDPGRPRTAYLNWNHAIDFVVGGQSEEYFSKTIDGGATWSTPSKLPIPTGPNDFLIGGVVHVLPDRGLVSTYVRHPNNVFPPPATFELIRSRNAGDSWSAPIRIASAAPSILQDPDTLDILNKANDTPGQPTYAVGPFGEIYGTWSQIDSPTSSRILVVRSLNGGRTWSAPRAMKTSQSQVFEPTIAVSQSGAVGVTYLDFRNDRLGDAELTTDVWFSSSIDGGRTWAESHVYGPFDYRAVPTSGGNATSIGDTFGLVATGRYSFGAAFPAALEDPSNGVTDIFFARLGL